MVQSGMRSGRRSEVVLINQGCSKNLISTATDRFESHLQDFVTKIR